MQQMPETGFKFYESGGNRMYKEDTREYLVKLDAY